MDFTEEYLWTLLKNLVPSQLERCTTHSIFIRNVPPVRNRGILSILKDQNVCLFTIDANLLTLPQTSVNLLCKQMNFLAFSYHVMSMPPVEKETLRRCHVPESGGCFWGSPFLQGLVRTQLKSQRPRALKLVEEKNDKNANRTSACNVQTVVQIFHHRQGCKKVPLFWELSSSWGGTLL